MSNYKDFTLNDPGNNPNWAAREKTLFQNIIDTLVKDAVVQTKDTVNGHQHYRVHASDGSVVGITLDASGNITFNQHTASASNYKAVYVDENGAIAMKYNITGIPTTLFIKDGDVVNKIIGALNYEQMKQVLGKL